MAFTTLISTNDLLPHLNNPDWVIVDCRFSLADTELGWREYQANHIPGAVYANLDDDLSGTVVPGQSSRHPLPEIEVVAQTLSNWGVDSRTQVVAYDSFGGGIAARLWWMLRWLGHKAVAVLDGGWQQWQREDHPVRSGTENRVPQNFIAAPQNEMFVSVNEVSEIRTDPDWRLCDSRAGERYRGETEPFDPVAGHIPGAVSLPFAGNLDESGTFLSSKLLRERFQKQLGNISAEQTIFYCGSGVTANHNILAMLHAGLGRPRLYPGSWSEWITDPDRPVATQ